MLGQGRLIKGIVVFAMISSALIGCSSNRKKYDQRDKIASASGLYCDFVNGDKFKEVELELNINMAKRCDVEKPYSVTGYKNASEVHGLVYCCNMKKAEAQPKVQPAVEKKAAPTQGAKTGDEPEASL